MDPDLKGFADEVLNLLYDNTFELDAFDIQSLGLKHGLIETVKVDESCGDNCTCGEWGEFPAMCYRKTYGKTKEN